MDWIATRKKETPRSSTTICTAAAWINHVLEALDGSSFGQTYLVAGCKEGDALLDRLHQKLFLSSLAGPPDGRPTAGEGQDAQASIEARALIGVMAVSRLYGIDERLAHVQATRSRLRAKVLQGIEPSEFAVRALDRVLELNIIHGDYVRCVDAQGQPIRVSKWHVHATRVCREEYALDGMRLIARDIVELRDD